MNRSEGGETEFSALLGCLHSIQPEEDVLAHDGQSTLLAADAHRHALSVRSAFRDSSFLPRAETAEHCLPEAAGKFGV